MDDPLTAGNWGLLRQHISAGSLDEFFRLGPAAAGEAKTPTIDDVQITGAGGALIGGVDFGYFIVEYGGRRVQVAVEHFGTALPMLATPTMTKMVSGSTVTLTISDIAVGTTHLEIYESTNGTSWPEEPVAVLLPTSPVTYSTKPTATRYWRARATGNDRRPSAYTPTISHIIGASTTTPLVIDDSSVAGARVGLGETVSFSPTLTSSGVAPVSWSVATFMRYDYNFVSIPYSKLLRLEFSQQTGYLILQVPGGGNRAQTIDLNPKVITGYSTTLPPLTPGAYPVEIQFTVADRPIVPLVYTATDSATPTPQTDTEQFTIWFPQRPTLVMEVKVGSGAWTQVSDPTVTYTAIGGHSTNFMARANVSAIVETGAFVTPPLSVRAYWLFSENPRVVSQTVTIPVA